MVGPEEGGDLKVLRLRIRPSGASVAVVFELAVGGETRGRVEAQLEELGWGTTSSRTEPEDPANSFHPPDRVADALSGLIGPILDPQEILWLRFSRPSGGLGLLPWERWLAEQVTGSPVVRWPYFDLAPVKIGRTTEIAVCASMPQAKHPFALPALLGPVIHELADSSLQASFHVFVDGALEPEVRTALRDEMVSGRVKVVAPESARPFGAAPRAYDLAGDSDDIESPWLRWMLAEGPPRLDVVLFLSHGYLADSRGSLAFSESPLLNRDREWARFVGSHQLRRFLDRSGAAMLVLVSPPDNHSLSGLFALADEVARDRPGPVLVHDLGRAQPEVLAPTLSLLLGKGTGPLPGSEAQALYALPEQVGASRTLQGTGPGGAQREALGSFDPGEAQPPSVEAAVGAYTIASPDPETGFGVDVPGGSGRGADEPGGGSLRVEVGEDSAERWVATSQRILERHTGDLLRTGAGRSEVAKAARSGRAEALKFVADLLKKGPEV